MSLQPMIYVYESYDAEGTLDNSKEGTPGSLAALFGVLAPEALWRLDPRTLLRLELNERVAVIFARIDEDGSCTWLDAPRDDTSKLELTDPAAQWKRGRLDWNAWPPTFDGEPLHGIGIYVLDEVRHKAERLAAEPATRTSLHASRAEIDEYVAEFFPNDLGRAVRVLLAGASVGTSTSTIASFLGVPKTRVAAMVRRLSASGVFTRTGVLARWHIPSHPPLDLMLDAMVATGEFRRVAPLDGPPRYHLASTDSAAVDEGEG